MANPLKISLSFWLKGRNQFLVSSWTRACTPQCLLMPAIGRVGRRFGLEALLRFACLREAATAKAGHAGMAFRPTITRGLALSAILI